MLLQLKYLHIQLFFVHFSYDDIEAFVLQLEGKKRWRVYNPLSKVHIINFNPF